MFVADKSIYSDGGLCSDYENTGILIKVMADISRKGDNSEFTSKINSIVDEIGEEFFDRTTYTSLRYKILTFTIGHQMSHEDTVRLIFDGDGVPLEMNELVIDEHLVEACFSVCGGGMSPCDVMFYCHLQDNYDNHSSLVSVLEKMMNDGRLLRYEGKPRLPIKRAMDRFFYAIND